jgi:hypothetical protein
MKKRIVYCGLVCSDCPTFLATKNDDDDAAREKTAAFYSEKFGFNLKPEDINQEILSASHLGTPILNLKICMEVM